MATRLSDENMNPVFYRIEIQGTLDEKWSDWFNGIRIDQTTDRTILTGMAIDQSRLRGILGKLWDLNLTVLSVRQVNPFEENNVSPSGGT